MSMTKEELLRERYIVLNDYPNNYLLEVGQVLIANAKGNFCVADDEGFITIYPEKYPAIFRRLDWSEHRKESEMPEYISYVSLTLQDRIYGTAYKSDDDFYKARVFVKVRHWNQEEDGRWYYNGNQYSDISGSYLPAAKEEFDNYQQNK